MISIINSPHKCLSLDSLSWLVSTRSTQEQANESAEFLLLVLNRPFFQLFFQLYNFQRQANIHRFCRGLDLKKDSLPIEGKRPKRAEIIAPQRRKISQPFVRWGARTCPSPYKCL